MILKGMGHGLNTLLQVKENNCNTKINVQKEKTTYTFSKKQINKTGLVCFATSLGTKKHVPLAMGGSFPANDKQPLYFSGPSKTFPKIDGKNKHQRSGCSGCLLSFS